MSVSEDQKTIVSFTDVIRDHEGKWMVERIVNEKVFSEMFRKWEYKPKKVEWLPLSVWKPELKKEVSTLIIFKREAISTHSLMPLSAFFKQKIRVTANRDDPNEYLNVFEGRIFIHDLALRTTQMVGMLDPKIKRLGTPERISLEEATKLSESGIRVYSESPTGQLAVRFNF